MSAWIRCIDRLPETEWDGMENVSRVVLIRVGRAPYTARYVAADEEMESDSFWRLLGQDGYRFDADEVIEWCEVPA